MKNLKKAICAFLATCICVAMPVAAFAEEIVPEEATSSAAVVESGAQIGDTLISPSITHVAINGTAQVTAKVLPTDKYDQAVIWESLDPDIASIDENGVVTGLAHGYAWIKATAVTNEKFVDIALIHVKGEVEPSEPDVPSEPVAPSEPDVPSEPVAPSEPEVPSEPVAPSEPEVPSEPVDNGDGTPDTADESNAFPMVALAVASMTAILVVMKKEELAQD